MSKRDMRTKRLLLAVLLAMSVQSYHAVPTWAEESGQTVKQAVKVDGEENAGTITVPADSESEAAAATDVDQEESAAAAAPAVTYSSRTAGSGTDDYGVMPLADQAINGALTGVTTINGANFKVGTAGSGSDSIAIGVGAELVYENSMGRIGENATVIGNKAAAPTHGTAIGYSAQLNEDAIGSIALGSLSSVTNSDAIAIGAEAKVSNQFSIAIGASATASNYNSIAIGYRSTTNADNQVSFGTMGDTSTYRSLAGIKNIDMNGALTGVTTINTANFQVVTGSLAIGQSSETVNASKYSLAIGNTALVIGGESNIAVGHSAKVDGGNLNIVVGSDAKVTGGGNNVVVGFMAEVTQYKNSSIAIGDRATAGGSSGVAIGSGSKLNEFVFVPMEIKEEQK